MKYLRQLLVTSVRATVFLLLLLSVQTASAKSPPFYWDFINVLIDVQENGDMLVTETQKYVFTGPHTNERYRYIPLDKVDSIDQIEVYEGEDKRAVTTNIKNGQLWIKWWHKLNQSHTFVLKYRVKGGIQIHGEEDWVHVKAIFKDRAAPIKSGKVTVRLPDALAGKISSFKSFGVPAEAWKSDGRTVEFLSQGSLPSGQPLAVQVVFPHGVLDVSMSEWQRNYWKKKAAQYKATVNSINLKKKIERENIRIPLFTLLGISIFAFLLHELVELLKFIQDIELYRGNRRNRRKRNENTYIGFIKNFKNKKK